MQFLGEVVVVEHLLQKETASGLHIPETVEGNLGRHTVPVKAIVKYLGSKVNCEHIAVKDTVLVPYHLGTRIERNGEKLVVYDFEDVIAVL